MRLLSQAPVVIDGHTAAVVYRYRTGPTVRGRHSHPTLHQLSWTPDGVLDADVAGVRWAVPSGVALWIPAGRPHRVQGSGGAIECVDVKTYPPLSPVDLPEPTLVGVTPLLRSLLCHLADPALAAGERRRAEAVFFDQLRPTPVPGVDVPLPTDRRARRVADALLRRPADDRPLTDWAHVAGVSPRTLTRLLSDETGTGFLDYRLRIRVAAALSHLAAGETVVAAGRKVGYLNASAFIEAFKRCTGTTPRDYGTRYLAPAPVRRPTAAAAAPPPPQVHTTVESDDRAR